MAIATNTNLTNLRSDILSHGVSDWTTMLAMAENDVIERIKVEWYINAAEIQFGYGTAQYNAILNSFNRASVNDSLLVNLVCYRAMAFYIYPSLTRDTDDGQDSFTRRAERYAHFYESEWQRVQKMPIYDFTGDSAYNALDRTRGGKTIRVVRG